mmetsp:Transcript_44811/g.111060  ORF Transcript_44811/g.111060 Transcript_44811/m.111060 type:complete len:258 (-) Transcript_44811:2-775(-)
MGCALASCSCFTSTGSSDCPFPASMRCRLCTVSSKGVLESSIASPSRSTTSRSGEVRMTVSSSSASSGSHQRSYSLLPFARITLYAFSACEQSTHNSRASLLSQAAFTARRRIPLSSIPSSLASQILRWSFTSLRISTVQSLGTSTAYSLCSVRNVYLLRTSTQSICSAAMHSRRVACSPKLSPRTRSPASPASSLTRGESVSRSLSNGVKGPTCERTLCMAQAAIVSTVDAGVGSGRRGGASFGSQERESVRFWLA